SETVTVLGNDATTGQLSRIPGPEDASNAKPTDADQRVPQKPAAKPIGSHYYPESEYLKRIKEEERIAALNDAQRASIFKSNATPDFVNKLGISGPPNLKNLHAGAIKVAHAGIPFSLGGKSLDDRGLDQSGAVRFLLSEIGVVDVPKHSAGQYEWLKSLNQLETLGASGSALSKVKPGNLVFWNHNNRPSQVMLYLGFDAAKSQHFVYGVKDGKSRGLTGNLVDVFVFDQKSESVAAIGRIPGI
ncbi:MAG: NlpC/P60 family protein, partial [Verrucomicrobiota bacterium]